MKIFIKKFIILFLLTIAPTQLAALFIRGAIYKNEKTGQIVILLADLHSMSELKDLKILKQYLTKTGALIEYLSKLDKKSTLTIVEDIEEYDMLQNNNKFIEAKKRVDALLKEKNINKELISSLTFLTNNLRKSGINTINVECRHIETTLCAEIWATIDLKKQGKKVEQQLTAKDLKNEITRNIENLKTLSLEIEKLKQNYSEKEFTFLKTYFIDSIKYSEQKSLEYIEILNKVDIDLNSLPVETLCQIATLINKIMHLNLSVISIFLDTSILGHIIKNHYKTHITVCAGIGHTARIEYILSDIGYKLFYETGVKNISKEATHRIKLENNELGAFIKEKPASIDIDDLFKNLNKTSLVPEEDKQLLNLTYYIWENSKEPFEFKPILKAFLKAQKELTLHEEIQKKYSSSKTTSENFTPLCNMLVSTFK